MESVRFVAIGDSFSEGVGDELADGTVRGWADLAALGWASARNAPIEYANLAIRGKLARPIIEEQLEPALALGPTHLSFNGGGNDMLRPRTRPEQIADTFAHVARRCDEEGVHLILLSGANPSAQLPLSNLIQRRGDALSRVVSARFADRTDITTAFNWPDRELSAPDFWSEDRLHMNARGHHRVAARVLSSLDLEVPTDWWHMPTMSAAARSHGAAYYRQHVGPWVKRRLTGTSSGDGRIAKFAEFTRILPPSPAHDDSDATAK